MTEQPYLPVAMPDNTREVRPALDTIPTLVFAVVTLSIALVSGSCPNLMEAIQQSDFLAFVVYMCMGAMLAMATNFALYMIFDKSHIGLRLLIAAMGFITIVAALATGLCIAKETTPGELIEGLASYLFEVFFEKEPARLRVHHRVVEPLLILCTGAPLLILTATIPYWMGRTLLGWRLVTPCATDRPPKMAIWHLFAATGVVAVAFPLMRVVSRVTNSDGIVPALIFFGAALAIFSAFQCIALWSIFRSPYLLVGVILAAIPLLITIASAVAARLLFTNRMATELSYGVPWMTAGFTIILVAPMIVLRLFDREIRAGGVEPTYVPPRPASPFDEDHVA